MSRVAGCYPNGGWFNKVDVSLRVTKAAKCGQGIHHSESDGYYESQSTAIGPSPNGGWFNKVDVTLRVTKAAKCGQGIHHSESDGYYESAK